MASLRCTAELCCSRHSSPALLAFRPFRSGQAGCAGERAVTAIPSFTLRKPLSRWFASGRLFHGAGADCSISSSRWIESRSPFSLCAVAGRAYYTDGEYSNEASKSTGGTLGQQQQQQNNGVVVPRPLVMQYDEKLANNVQLIGYVGQDVEIKHLESGKIVAKTRLLVKKSVFDLEAWDANAEIAAQYIRKGDHVFVAGSVVVEKWKTFTFAKVVVGELFFVESYDATRQAYSQADVVAPHQQEFVEMGSHSRSEEVANSGSSQRNFQPSPGTRVQQRPVTRNYDDVEKGWQAYFADPSQWWDNRHNKRNPKSPDFKHKSTGEALWIISWKNPPWVAQQLAVLEKAQIQHNGEFGNNRQYKQSNKLSSFNDYELV